MKSIKFLVLILLCVIQVSVSLAVPAYPKLIKFSQPDGTKVNIFLKGDEFAKWAETEDGYTLLYNNSGYLEYAVQSSNGDIVPSGIKATNIKKRNTQTRYLLSATPKKLKYSKSQISIINQIKDVHHMETINNKAFPTTGNRKLICILVSYTDKAFTKTQADFNNLFNQVNYTAGGATGSVKDYFLENSYNQFNLTVDVAGPFTASQNMAYYGANDVNNNDIRPGELIAEAINLADPTVNFTQYDNDNDGTVDGVYVIFAGYGEEAGGGANLIWSHASLISPTLVKDGMSFKKYSCSPELQGSSGANMTHIGVICHEFGHVLGAPDYYDTDYAVGGQYQGLGIWDIMDSGTWNNSGATPAHHNGFTKVVIFNWATVNVLNSASTITLYNAAEFSNSFYRVNTTTPDEYYFIENREKHKFDLYIPGSGMMIYHVHSTVISAAAMNNINNTYPQKMYAVAQNATSDPNSNPASFGTINSPTCAWTGISGKTEFSDTSIPSSKSWSGINTVKPITNILRNPVDKTVTFDILGGVGVNPVTFQAVAAGSSQIDLSWLLYNGNDVMIAWTPDGNFGTPVTGNSYNTGSTIPGGGSVIYKGNSTSFNHGGLTGNTSYYYKAWSVLPGNNYSNGAMTEAKTPCGSVLTYPYTEGFSALTQPDCWSIIDHVGNNQVWQFGTGGVLNGASGNYAYLNSDAYGQNNSQNTDLITPTLNFSGMSGITLSYTHYYRHYTGSSARLSYSIDNGQSWTQIQQWTTSTANPATFNQIIPAVANKSQVKFKWNYTGSWAYYWSIDNISINGTVTCPPPVNLNANNLNVTSADLSWNAGGSETTWEYVYGLAPLAMPASSGISVSNNQVTVSGLTAVTNYQFYVRAVCGGISGNSIWSGPYSFSTSGIQCQNYDFPVDISICEGEISTWRGNHYSIAGIYYDSLLTINPPGCDSVYVLNLTVNPVYNIVFNENIWDYQVPFVWEGTQYWTAGTYYKYYQTAEGCDSTLQLNLTIGNSGSIWVDKNIGTAVQANWSPVAGATQYQLRHALAGTQNWISTNSTNQTRFRIINLTPATQYDLQVRYFDGTTWSDWAYFMPLTFETEVVNFAFTRDIGTSVIIEWTALPDVSTYILQYKLSTSSTWLNAGEHATNSAQMSTQLNDNTTYDFRVIPRYQGVSMWWTAPQPLTTLNVQYTLSKDIGTRAILSFTPIPNATKYILLWKESTSGVWKTASTVGNSTTLNGLSSSTQYDFKVNVYFGTTVWGTTASKSQTTNKINIAVSNYIGTAATFTWDPVVNPNASAFYLQTREVGTTNWASKYTTTNTATVTGLNPLKTYEYRLIVRYGSPEVSWGTTEIYVLTGAKETNVAQQTTLNVYPNPVSDLLTVSVNSTDNTTHIWKLYDVSGRIVAEGTHWLAKGNNIFEIEMLKLSAGLYVFHSNISGSVEKVVINKL